ncbi:MAG: PilN domain-containing protein [Candidatus Eremiobacteraeota bacterium]|nr:PilN domain-containing protein [Candidatus Eremiobacteraeota bacterium]
MTIKVDLLPTERKRIGFDPVMGILLLVVVVFAVAFWVYGTHLKTNIEKKKQEIVEYDNKIKDMESKLPIIEEIRKKNEVLRRQIETVKGLVYDPIRYANILRDIPRIMPENIWLPHLSIEPGTNTVNFSGTSVEYKGKRPLSAIASLMTNLQKSRYFLDATLASANQIDVEGVIGYTFAIETHYDPKAAAGLKAKKGGGAE